MTNGPEFWKRVLGSMPEGSIIAGGAVRDFLLGTPPKDIDVFCPMSALHDFDWAGFEPLENDRGEEYDAMGSIEIVQRTYIEDVQVDLVGVNIPEWSGGALVETFDFGIARCWFDGEAIHDTPEAKADRENLTVTVLLDDRLDRSLQRFNRFNERQGNRFTLAGYEPLF